MKKINYSLVVVMAIDGKIAFNSRHMTDWSSKEDKIFLHNFLDKSDVVVVGNNTFKIAKEPLLKRNCVVFTRKIRKVLEKYPGLIYLNPEKEDLNRFLRSRGYRRVAVLGGEESYTYFLEKNLLDEIYLTIEPVIFGGGLGIFHGRKFLRRDFKLASVKKLNTKGSLLLHYQRAKLCKE